MTSHSADLISNPRAGIVAPFGRNILRHTSHHLVDEHGSAALRNVETPFLFAYTLPWLTEFCFSSVTSDSLKRYEGQVAEIVPRIPAGSKRWA